MPNIAEMKIAQETDGARSTGEIVKSKLSTSHLSGERLVQVGGWWLSLNFEMEDMAPVQLQLKIGMLLSQLGVNLTPIISTMRWTGADAQKEFSVSHSLPQV